MENNHIDNIRLNRYIARIQDNLNTAEEVGT